MDLHCGLSLWLQFQRSLESWVYVARKPKTPESTASPSQLRESTRQLRKNRVSRIFFEPPVLERRPSSNSVKDNDKWYLLGNTFSVRFISIIFEIIMTCSFLSCLAVLYLIYTSKGLMHCFHL